MRLPPQTEIGGTTEWIRNLGPSGGENRVNRNVFEALAERLQEVEISFFFSLSPSLSHNPRTSRDRLLRWREGLRMPPASRGRWVEPLTWLEVARFGRIFQHCNTLGSIRLF